MNRRLYATFVQFFKQFGRFGFIVKDNFGFHFRNDQWPQHCPDIVHDYRNIVYMESGHDLTEPRSFIETVLTNHYYDIFVSFRRRDSECVKIQMHIKRRIIIGTFLEQFN